VQVLFCLGLTILEETLDLTLELFDLRLFAVKKVQSGLVSLVLCDLVWLHAHDALLQLLELRLVEHDSLSGVATRTLVLESDSATLGLRLANLTFDLRWVLLELLVDCFDELRKVRVLVPVLDQWASVSVSVLLKVWMNNSGHARNDRTRLWESLQKTDLNVQRQRAHWKRQWHAEIVALRRLPVGHCLWVKLLQTLNRNILLEVSLHHHLLLILLRCEALAHCPPHHVVVRLLLHSVLL
jgi:hypothetical protein